MYALIGWSRWALGAIGYKIRPYDMIADRRRWCWQPRTPCGWTGWTVDKPGR